MRDAAGTLTDGAPGRVLVVDDNDAKRYVLARWLIRRGYEVVEASSGQGALDAVHEHLPELVVLDVHLPDMSGIEVCRRLRAAPATAELSVVHVSAVAVEPADRTRGLTEGADAYLVDPIDPQELVATVATMLRSSRARRRAQRWAVQLGRLNTLTLRINLAASPSRLAAPTAEAVATVGGGTGAVLLLVGDEVVCEVCREAGEGTEAVPLGRQDAERVLGEVGGGHTWMPGTRVPWAGAARGDGDVRWRLVPVRSGDSSLLGVLGHRDAPGEQTGGSACVERPTPETVTEEHVTVQRLALTVGAKLDNLRALTEERRIALTLQRSLLPAITPAVPGLELGTAYAASEDHAEIGGDFFDAFCTDDGAAVVAVGDVQGHSLAAAVVMAELRYSLRAFAQEGHDPQRVLGLLNAVMLRNHPHLTATVCILTFTPSRDSVAVVNAGHIPPLWIVGGDVTLLDRGGPLLGVPVGARAPQILAFPPGGRAVLVTDGMVERRGVPTREGMEAVVAQVLAAPGHLPLDDLCRSVLREQAGGEDDAAIVVVRRPEKG